MDKATALLNRIRGRLDSVIHYPGISGKQANLILWLIIVVIFLLRISTIQKPAIDRTTWKEIDYITISSNYAEHGYNFFRPEVSWPADEPRATAMELPLAPYLASWLYPAFGLNAYTVRVVTLISFLLLIFYVYKLVKREAGTILALTSAFFAGLLPVFSPYGNNLLSEPLMIFLSVFSVFSYAQWASGRNKWNLLWFILGYSITVALKPTALYLLLPLFWIHFREYRFQLSRYLSFIWPVALAMVIPVLWFLHAWALSRNAIDVFGVFGGKFGGHDKFQTVAMLSDPAWYLLMYWRLKIILLGEAGMFFMGIGVLSALFFRKGWLFLAYFLAIISFFIIVAEGNIDADYRQLTIIPPASFLIPLGIITFIVSLYTFVIDFLGFQAKKAVAYASVVLSLVMLTLFPIRKEHAIRIFQDKDIPAQPDNWAFAQEIKKVATDSSKIIMAGEYSMHKGGNDVSPVTYYYSGLKGWTIQEGEWNREVINNLKNKGADLFGAIYYSREAGLAAFVKDLKKDYEVLYHKPEKGILLLRLE